MEARLLLVHSPLVGCGTWEPIAKDLASDGYAVAVPDLAGTVTAGPPYHLRQAQVIADSADGQPAILIGHSGAGPLLATAGRMPVRQELSHHLALLTEPGRVAREVLRLAGQPFPGGPVPADQQVPGARPD
jgi:hypothetical protein